MTIELFGRPFVLSGQTIRLASYLSVTWLLFGSVTAYVHAGRGWLAL